MVIPLRASKFYGSSLPRPQIYTDVKYSQERVDPPLSMLDPLLSWAQDAHWSMGGLSFKRVHHQGKIEGNLSKLRAEGEKRNKKNGVIAGKIEKLRAEKERASKVVAEKEQGTKRRLLRAEKEVVAEKEKSPKVIEKKAKIGKVLKKRVVSKAKSKKGKSAAPPAPVSPIVPESDGGLRRSKRRKLVLRDEDDEETEF